VSWCAGQASIPAVLHWLDIVGQPDQLARDGDHGRVIKLALRLVDLSLDLQVLRMLGGRDVGVAAELASCTCACSLREASLPCLRATRRSIMPRSQRTLRQCVHGLKRETRLVVIGLGHGIALRKSSVTVVRRLTCCFTVPLIDSLCQLFAGHPLPFRRAARRDTALKWLGK
jgi:hypothetical protein